MTTAPPARHRLQDLVGQVADESITRWQKGYLADQSAAVATLAQLRRGAGKLPQDMPELWGMIGTEALFEEDLSETEAIRAENALFLAVTLYALHQQSRTEQGMHQPGIELGAAVRRMMPGNEIDEPIRRRFVRVGAASTPDVLAYRLRELVTLLRRYAIPLDYRLLATRLYQAQTPDGMRRVRQIWGGSFHAYRPENADTENTPIATTNDKDAR
ncbi:type I-E CRISPR-associated protein Cse2/CasB [Thermomonospora catenispora]|uniref:type I-E CRISPR-associated protein Cse2/CasB n=1 Tax=Thermomonospora catenispora TaxID=2493090 RepID=UPI00111ECF4B|nr:type I-E CRISPR-associated protein Cse2/CasB [Thermomonospora catenispora]TNY37284.1 type I-E CRISPR-associated protein Cse2/CasB [Thermomonospora catenispora]